MEHSVEYDVERSVEHGQEAINPFERVKARHLVGWLVAALPLLIVATVFVDNTLFQELLVHGWVYGVPLVWYVTRARRKGLSVRKLAGSFPQSKKWLWYALLNIPVILLSVGSIIVIYTFIAKVWPAGVEGLLSQSPEEIAVDRQYPVWATLLDIFGALILAPIVEEFIFRGFLLHRWAAKWGIVKAIVVVSIIFGILHVNFFGAAVFSILLCAIYLYTGSIWPPILLHFINNVISTLPSTGGGEETALNAADLQGALVGGVVLVVISLPILLWFIKKHWPARDIILPYHRPGSTLP